MPAPYGAVALVVVLVVATTVYIAAPQGRSPQTAALAADAPVLHTDLAGRWVRLSPETRSGQEPAEPEIQIININADGTFRCEVRSTVETLWAEGTYCRSHDSLRFHITASGFPEGAGEGVEATFFLVGSSLRLRTERPGIIQSCDLARIGDTPA